MKKFLLPLLAALCGALIAGEEYNFYMLSDTHFGPLASFGANPPAKLQRKGQRADAALPLYREFFAEMAKRRDAKTAFLIHAGDLIEGNAESKEAQVKQFTDAAKLLKEHFKMPVYLVRGNHEGAGKFGRDAYQESIAPAIARISGQPAGTVHYTIRHGGDMFIFVDPYTRGWLSYVSKTLKSLKRKPRYLFLALHPDQLPHARKEVVNLCRMLAPYNAVILSGHTHRTRLLKYTRFGGEVTQFSIGSHLSAPARVMQYKQKDTDMAEFLADFRKRRVRTPAQNELFDREIVPYLSGYEEYNDGEKFRAQGYAKLHVSDAGIVAEIQSGDLSQEPFRIMVLDNKNHREKQK